tara:strand:- start:1725 stop:2804 length:1080 start_codon:yes stop_codon:yes gene_type:complete
MYVNVYKLADETGVTLVRSGLRNTSLQLSGSSLAAFAGSDSQTSTTLELPNFSTATEGLQTTNISITASLANATSTNVYFGTAVGSTDGNNSHENDVNNDFSISTRVNHPIDGQSSGLGSVSLTNQDMLLINDSSSPSSGINKTNDETDEGFFNETNRMQSASYDSMPESQTTDWSSTERLDGTDEGHKSGLAVYANKLISPKKVGDSGVLTGKYVPTQTSGLDYVNLNNGSFPRTYFRMFKNSAASSSPGATLTLDGNGYNIVDYGTSLSTSNIHISVKIPGKTAFVDIASDKSGDPFTSGDSDFRGCRDASAGTFTNTNCPITFGGNTVNQDEFLVLRIEADKSWTGYISNISISFN